MLHPVPASASASRFPFGSFPGGGAGFRARRGRLFLCVGANACPQRIHEIYDPMGCGVLLRHLADAASLLGAEQINERSLVMVDEGRRIKMGRFTIHDM